MAVVHGQLGAADLAATTETDIYFVPTGKRATVNINICNRNSSSVSVRLAHSNAGQPVANDAYWKEYDYTIGANDAIERTGIAMSAGFYIIAYASTTGVSVQVQGVEEDV